MDLFKVQFIDTANWKQLKSIWNLYEPKLKISNGLIDSNIYNKQTLFTLTALQTFHGLRKENVIQRFEFSRTSAREMSMSSTPHVYCLLTSPLGWPRSSLINCLFVVIA